MTTRSTRLCLKSESIVTALATEPFFVPILFMAATVTSSQLESLPQPSSQPTSPALYSSFNQPSRTLSSNMYSARSQGSLPGTPTTSTYAAVYSTFLLVQIMQISYEPGPIRTSQLGSPTSNAVITQPHSEQAISEGMFFSSWIRSP
jgi:hypothetical protein